jgi:hypothetical protein
MGDDICAKMFHAGQQDERLRLCQLIDIRLYDLRKLARVPTISARLEELLHIRHLLQDHP